MGEILQEVTEQLFGNELSRNVADLVKASYFDNQSTSLVSDPSFNDGLSNWSQWNNTDLTTEASSEVSVFFGEKNSTVLMTIESNSLKDQTAYQHGIDQLVSLTGVNLDDTYMVSRYSELSGLLEQEFFGGEDSGASVIAIEYLDDAERKIGGTYIANTSQGIFTDSGFYGAPVSLSASANEYIYKAPAVGNNALVMNIGREARRAIPTRINEVVYLRIAAVVTDYIGSDYVRHFLTGIILSDTPECTKCRATLKLHALDVRMLTD